MCAWYNTVPWVFRHWIRAPPSQHHPLSLCRCLNVLSDTHNAHMKRENKKHTISKRHTHTPAETKNNHTSKWYLWDVRGAFAESVDECDWMRTRERCVATTPTKNQRRYIYITKWLYLLIHISPESVFFCWILRFVFRFIRLFFIVSPSHFELSILLHGCCFWASPQFFKVFILKRFTDFCFVL